MHVVMMIVMGRGCHSGDKGHDTKHTAGDGEGGLFHVRM